VAIPVGFDEAPSDIVEDGLSAGEDVQLLLDVGTRFRTVFSGPARIPEASRACFKEYGIRGFSVLGESLGASGLRDDIL